MHLSPVRTTFFEAGMSGEPVTRRTYFLKEKTLISFLVE